LRLRSAVACGEAGRLPMPFGVQSLSARWRAREKGEGETARGGGHGRRGLV